MAPFGVDISVFHETVTSPLTRQIYNASMYVRFGGVKNTKTWSKSAKHVMIEK